MSAVGAGASWRCSWCSLWPRSACSSHGGDGGGRVVYDRAAAAAYADRWALSANPAYWRSRHDDCANFVSQCVAAGGLRAFERRRRRLARRRHADFPSIGWVNCDAQQRVWGEAVGDARSPYIVSRTTHAAARLGRRRRGLPGKRGRRRAQWQHVIICVGAKARAVALRQPYRGAQAPASEHVVSGPLLAHPLLPPRGCGGLPLGGEKAGGSGRSGRPLLVAPQRLQGVDRGRRAGERPPARRPRRARPSARRSSAPRAACGRRAERRAAAGRRRRGRWPLRPGGGRGSP